MKDYLPTITTAANAKDKMEGKPRSNLGAIVCGKITIGKKESEWLLDI